MADTIKPIFYAEESIGVNLFGLEDKTSGYSVYTTLADKERQYPSLLAFAGARYSRSGLSIEELFREIKDAKKGAEKRLADIFNNYGHASVGDMAQLFAYIEHVPFFASFFLFYHSAVGAGQERSSRFQSYGKSSLPELGYFFSDTDKKQISPKLQSQYTELESFALASYQKYKGILTDSYRDYYKPKDDAKEIAALASRVNDSVRSFLLSGFGTSFAYITSAREWARLIGELKARDNGSYKPLGTLLESLFVPSQEVTSEYDFHAEAPDLFRHTEPDLTIQKNLEQLSQYIDMHPDLLDGVAIVQDIGKYIEQDVCLLDVKPADMFLVQYILTLYPSYDVTSLSKKIASLSKPVRKSLSKILFAGHDNYVQMDGMARLGAYSYAVRMSIGEARDLNRHRAFGRYTSLLEYPLHPEEFIQRGFTIPLYLEVPEMKKIKEKLVSDMSLYFDKLAIFFASLKKEDKSYASSLPLYLLPLGTNILYFLHGSVKEVSYMTRQRVRPGGHINYRDVAFQMAKKLADTDSLYTRIAISEKPDLANREEFFDRS